MADADVQRRQGIFDTIQPLLEEARKQRAKKIASSLRPFVGSDKKATSDLASLVSSFDDLWAGAAVDADSCLGRVRWREHHDSSSSTGSSTLASGVLLRAAVMRGKGGRAWGGGLWLQEEKGLRGRVVMYEQVDTHAISSDQHGQSVRLSLEDRCSLYIVPRWKGGQNELYRLLCDALDLIDSSPPPFSTTTPLLSSSPLDATLPSSIAPHAAPAPAVASHVHEIGVSPIQAGLNALKSVAGDVGVKPISPQSIDLGGDTWFTSAEAGESHLSAQGMMTLARLEKVFQEASEGGDTDSTKNAST